MTIESPGQELDTLVIGGGQAGLVVGHGLAQHGIDFMILDAGERIGDAWRNRWDSLRLFTQARMNGLPGMAFPGPGGEFVGKDAVADFLETYAESMRLPVLSGVRVEALIHEGDTYIAETTQGTFRARNVVVAMAGYQKPKTPEFAGELSPSVIQMHSSSYKNPDQLQDGPVLVVGLGNSGADIASESVKTHPTIVSGTEKGAIPFALEGWFGRHLGTRLVRFAMVKVLNTSTSMGRRIRPKMLRTGPPLVRVRPKELAKAGVERVSRIVASKTVCPSLPTDPGSKCRMSSGAPAIPTASTGSTCLSSTTAVIRSTPEEWYRANPVCTSSGSSFSIRHGQRPSPGSNRTRDMSSTISSSIARLRQIRV